MIKKIERKYKDIKLSRKYLLTKEIQEYLFQAISMDTFFIHSGTLRNNVLYLYGILQANKYLLPAPFIGTGCACPRKKGVPLGDDAHAVILLPNRYFPHVAARSAQ